MKTIPLTQGYFAKVDNEDYIRLASVRWCAAVEKRKNGLIRVRAIRRGGKGSSQTTQYMHREILKVPKGKEVDHVNGDTLDNQKVNLRSATHTQNMQNSRPYRNAASKYKGVKPPRNYKKQWEAHIKVNKKSIDLGYFNSEIEAAKAYDSAAMKYFGKFAKLNF